MSSLYPMQSHHSAHIASDYVPGNVRKNVHGTLYKINQEAMVVYLSSINPLLGVIE